MELSEQSACGSWDVGHSWARAPQEHFLSPPCLGSQVIEILSSLPLLLRHAVRFPSAFHMK